MGTSCPCECHLNPYNPCSENGGCGGHHRKAGGCITCPVLRPNVDQRQPNRPPVCDGDRRLISRYLGEIGVLIADLTSPEDPIIDGRRYERFGIRYLEDGIREVVSLGTTWADPVAAVGGVAPINSRSKRPRVSGSHERPIPIDATALDLKAAARFTGNSRGVADWPEDQVGQLSVATVLDEWIRDVRSKIYPGLLLPPATIEEMVTWLRTPVGDERSRIDDICDLHPQVADFAAAVQILRGSLRAATGETEPKPQRCPHVECKQCDLLMLFKHPGGDVVCANPACQAVLRPEEYDEWAKTVVAKKRIEQRQHAGV